jgi:hypothetical protein
VIGDQDDQVFDQDDQVFTVAAGWDQLIFLELSSELPRCPPDGDSCQRLCPDVHAVEGIPLGLLCRDCWKQLIDRADTVGDGPMVNALCELARRKFGPGLYW